MNEKKNQIFKSIQFKISKQVLQELGDKYGPVMTFYFGAHRAVHLCNAEVIKEIIITRGKDFIGRPEPKMFQSESLKDGLVFATDSHWQKGRRWAMRAMRDFGMGKEQMVLKVNEEIGYMLDSMEALEGKTITTAEFLQSPISSVICMMIFSERFDEKNIPLKNGLDKIDQVLKESQFINFLHLCMPSLSYLLAPSISKNIQFSRHLIGGLMKKAIESHKKDFNPDDIRDFTDLYLQANGEIDYPHFEMMMVELFVAGQETSLTTLKWLFMLISLHPEYQRKCQKEIDSVIDTDRFPLTKDREHLPMVEAVINETARIASIVPISAFHSNAQSHTLKGYEIPADTVVIYNTFALHHNEKYWGDPEVFRPERWLDGDGKLVNHSDYFMPFGAGPRVCMGEQLAKVELFHFTVALLQRFDFKLESKVDDIDSGECGFTNNPPSYTLSFSKRHH